MILFAEFDSFPSNIESKIENPLELLLNLYAINQEKVITEYYL